MSKAQSLNWEINFDGNTIHPMSIGEFGEGEEGRIEVADGRVKYKIRDLIMSIDEIEVGIYIRKNKYEYRLLQFAAESGVERDVFFIGRNAAGEAEMTFLLENCDIVKGKKSAFERSGKAADTKKYFFIPENVVEVI